MQELRKWVAYYTPGELGVAVVGALLFFKVKPRTVMYLALGYAGTRWAILNLTQE